MNAPMHCNHIADYYMHEFYACSLGVWAANMYDMYMYYWTLARGY